MEDSLSGLSSTLTPRDSALKLILTTYHRLLFRSHKAASTSTLPLKQGTRLVNPDRQPCIHSDDISIDRQHLTTNTCIGSCGAYKRSGAHVYASDAACRRETVGIGDGDCIDSVSVRRAICTILKSLTGILRM
jgi:hypothetical protein